MSKETGGQAFPCEQWEYDGQNNFLQYQEEDMTLRDYFAAKAMQAMITTSGAPALSGLDDYEPITAKFAYKMADAMLEARKSQGEKMEPEEKSEEQLVKELREILNGIMEDYSCGRKEALRIAEQWIREAAARKAQNIEK